MFTDFAEIYIPIWLTNELAVFIQHVVGRRAFVHTFENGFRVRDILIRKKVVNCIVANFPLNKRDGQQRLNF